MKNCPNPKCKATGIPDNAQFCPKCGAPLVSAPNPWQEKYETMQKKRTKLLSQNQQLSEFEKARHAMYSTLKQNEAFEMAMQESVTKINSKRQKREKVKKIMIIGLVMFAIGVLLLNSGFRNTDAVEIIAIICIQIGVFVAVFGFIIWYNRKSITYSQYIANILEPFVNSHQEEYRLLNIPYSPKTFMSEVVAEEILAPDSVSKKISHKIESINKEVQEIDQQMQLMKDVM